MVSMNKKIQKKTEVVLDVLHPNVLSVLTNISVTPSTTTLLLVIFTLRLTNKLLWLTMYHLSMQLYC